MSTSQSLGDLIERVYHLATLLDGMTQASELLAAYTGSRSCALMLQDRRTYQVQGGWFWGLDLQWCLRYRDHHYQFDPTVVEHFQIPENQAYASAYHRGNRKFCQGIFYKEWCKPQKLGYFAGAYTTLEGDLSLRVTLQGDEKRGQYEPEILRDLAELLPHLKRAVEINHRFASLVSQSRAFSDVLDNSLSAIILQSVESKVIYTNAAAQALLGEGIGIRNGRVHVSDVAVRAEFDAAVQTCVATLAETTSPVMQGGCHVPVRRRGRLPMSVYVAPVRVVGMSRYGLTPDMIRLQLIDPERQYDMDALRLREVLGLTEAEARVGVLLCHGEGVPEISQLLRLSQHTVRDHLKSIFRRLDVSRQSEFVARVYSVLRPHFVVGAAENRH